MKKISIKHTENGLDIEFYSDYNNVDETVTVCEEYRKKNDLDISAFDLATVLHEVLCNAVRHGNKGNPEKKVWCCIRVEPETLKIDVKDEGDPEKKKNIGNKNDDPLKPHGMGMQIIEGLGFDYAVDYKTNTLKLVKKIKINSN